MDSCKRLQTRVAIIGVDSSRPARLLDFLSGPDAPAGCQVTHLLGLDGDAVSPLAEKYGVQATGHAVQDVLGAVDAVLLCTRDGRAHAAQAIPLLDAGIAVWVDKPLATREDDARAMTRAAAARGVPLACRSGFRDAATVSVVARGLRETAGPAAFTVEGPAEPDSPYGGLAHYGIHHVEVACEVLRQGRGARPWSVTEVVRDGDGVRARVLGGDEVTVDLVFRPGRTGFGLVLDGQSLPLEAPARYLEDQVGAFLTAVTHHDGFGDAEDLIAPVRLLEGIMTHR